MRKLFSKMDKPLLLVIVTFGIASLYVMPYFETVTANIYIVKNI